MQKQISDSRYCTSVAELNVQMDWCDKYEFGLAAFCGAMGGYLGKEICEVLWVEPQRWE